jgi:tetratricopeptide (TPR) repeat protein
MSRFPCVGFMPFSWARLLGGAAALLGERDKARAYYEQAIEQCTRLRHRPELALSHLQFAELLLDTGAMNRAPTETDNQGQAGLKPAPTEDEDSRAKAMQHLDIAIAELRDMKMQPALERALRHKEVLKA